MNGNGRYCGIAQEGEEAAIQRQQLVKRTQTCSTVQGSETEFGRC